MANKVPASVANPKRSDKIPTWMHSTCAYQEPWKKRIFDIKRQSGFTLIELMIVVAIVAILAAIALPAYQTYTKKAKFTEVVSATGAFKTAVEVCAQKDGDMANCTTPGSNGIPLDVSGASGSFVDSVTIAAGAASGAVEITATGTTPPFENTENTYILGGVLTNGQVIWTNAASGSLCLTSGIC